MNGTRVGCNRFCGTPPRSPLGRCTYFPPAANISCWQLRAVSLTERCPQPQGYTWPGAMTLSREQPQAMAGWFRIMKTRSLWDELKPQSQPCSWLVSHSDQPCLLCVLVSVCPKSTSLAFPHITLSQNLFPRQPNIRSKTCIHSNKVNTMEKKTKNYFNLGLVLGAIKLLFWN